MTLTFEHDQDRVKLNQRAKYPDQSLGLFRSKVIVEAHTQTRRHTDRQCSVWTTIVVGNKK